MSAVNDMALSQQYGWRRRCAWCGVVLRGWQLNRCTRCHRQDGHGLPWCRRASRWDAAPDTWGAS